MPKCDFDKAAQRLYWNHTSAWVFSCNFAAYFQNSFFKEHLLVAASVFLRTMMKLSKMKNCWYCIFKSVLIKDRILHHWGRRKWVSICFYFIINVVCIYIKYFFDVVRNKKEALAQVFSYEFCEISKNTFFHRIPLVVAPVLW